MVGQRLKLTHLIVQASGSGIVIICKLFYKKHNTTVKSKGDQTA